MENNGEINVYNPDKQISEQITLRNIVRHSLSMSLARDGTPEDVVDAPKTPNDRINQMYKGIQRVRSAQQTLINDSIAIVEQNNKNDWNKRNKKEESKEQNPFENEENDFNELIAILEFLDECEQKIIIAKETKSLDDDFVLEKEDSAGSIILSLSPNFFKMRKELETSYREIYGILIRNRIVSSGISVDEELAEKDKETELIRRILEA